LFDGASILALDPRSSRNPSREESPAVGVAAMRVNLIYGHISLNMSARRK